MKILRLSTTRTWLWIVVVCSLCFRSSMTATANSIDSANGETTEETPPIPTNSKETILIQVVYVTIHQQLTDPQVDILERLTRDFLRLRGKMDVELLKVTHQFLMDDPNRQVTEQVLALHLSLTGYAIANVVHVLNTEWNDYLQFLRIGLDDVFVDASSSSTATPSSTGGDDTIGSERDWILLVVSVALSVLAVASVIVIRQTGQRRLRLWYKGREYYRDGGNSDDSNTTTPHDMDPDCEGIIDLQQQQQYVLPERALSEESDGGWISAMSSINGGTTLSSIHELGVMEDFDYNDFDDKLTVPEEEYEEDGEATGTTVEQDEEGWIREPNRKVQGVLIYV